MAGRRPRFLIDAKGPGDGRVDLDASEVRHAHVRRLRSGDPVELFDGAGSSWIGHIGRVGRQTVSVEVDGALATGEGESPLAITLAMAALKADRFDWVIEKATELGVHTIVPFISRFSLARPSDSRQARWQQIAVSASKQCGRSVVPVVERPASWEELLARPPGFRLLFWEGERGGGLRELADATAVPSAVMIVIGPEGGLSTDEAQAARTAGCHVVGMGRRILRAETAAISTVALCQHLWGDLGPNAAEASPVRDRDVDPSKLPS